MVCADQKVKRPSRPRPSTYNTEAWLARRNTNPSARVTKRTTAIRVGILLALEEGPATAETIRKRMGLAPGAAELTTFLRGFEKRNLVRVAAVIPNRLGNRARVTVWELVGLKP